MPTPAQVQKDLQRVFDLRPPIDPETGRMVYAGRAAAQYRDHLQDILFRYGSNENFREAAGLPSPGAGTIPAKPPRRPPAPNFMAGPPTDASLAQFARSMMAPGPPPAAAGNVGPSALMPRRGAETIT